MFYKPWFWYQLSGGVHKCAARGLTAGEVALARKVFGGLIDYECVQVIDCPYLAWQSQDVVMAPRGCIHVHSCHYHADYACLPEVWQGLFIHEMAHILQHQRGINVLWRGAWLQMAYYLSGKRYNPYRYRLQAGKDFFAYNIEQQGEIARDIFLGKIPNILLGELSDG